MFSVKVPLFGEIFTLQPLMLLWHILGAYFLLIWGVGVVKIVFTVAFDPT